MGASNIRKVTAGGEVQFFEPTGPSFVSLKAPAALAADVPIILPTALPGVTEVLTIDAAGQIATGGAVLAGVALQVDLDETQAEVDALEVVVAGMGGGSTLQVAYDAGEDITLTAGKSILLTQPLNEALLALVKSGTGAGRVLSITDAGTGGALEIVQNGAKTALEVTQNGAAVGVAIAKVGGSDPILDLIGSSTISGPGLRIAMPSAGTGNGLTITQACLSSGIVVNRTFTGTSTGAAVNIQDAAVGSSSSALTVNKIAGSVGVGINVLQVNTDAGLVVTQSSAGASGRAAIFAKSGAASGTCVDITHAGNSGIALRVATTNAVLVADMIQGNDAVCVQASNTNAGSFAACVKCQHSGTDAAQRSLDMQGTNDSWRMTKGGVASLARFCLATSTTYVISAGGAITVWVGNQAGIVVVDTNAAAASDDLDTITLGYAPSGEPVIVLKAVNDARTVVVRHDGGGTGNIRLKAGVDFPLDSLNARVMLVWDPGTNRWCEI